MKTMAISVSCAVLTSRSRYRCSIWSSWPRSQATRGMSGLMARRALLAARTASSAGTVAVGSAMGTSAVVVSFARVALDRVGRAERVDRPERVDPSRARAVSPVAPAAAVRLPDRLPVPSVAAVALPPV